MSVSAGPTYETSITDPDSSGYCLKWNSDKTKIFAGGQIKNYPSVLQFTSSGNLVWGMSLLSNSKDYYVYDMVYIPSVALIGVFYGYSSSQDDEFGITVI